MDNWVMLYQTYLWPNLPNFHPYSMVKSLHLTHQPINLTEPDSSNHQRINLTQPNPFALPLAFITEF